MMYKIVIKYIWIHNVSNGIQTYFNIAWFKIANKKEKKDYPLNQFCAHSNKTSGKNQQAAKWK